MNLETSSADQNALPPIYLGCGKYPRLTHRHRATSLILNIGGALRFFRRVWAKSEVAK